MYKVSQVGIVRRVEGGFADIEIARSSSCGERCRTCSGGCAGTGMVVRLANPVGAVAGDIVRIETKAGSIVGSALFVYILPLVMMILGMVYGNRVGQRIYPGINPDAAGLLFGIAALVVFYFLLKMVDRRIATANSKPSVTAILKR